MRHTIHKLICLYLRRCGGAFHCYNYGAAGRYVQLMTETQYAEYGKRCNTGTHAMTPNVQAQAQPPSKDMERKNDKR